jgi:hypothetical protein
MQGSVEANFAHASSCFPLFVSVVSIAFAKYPRRQNTNYVEKDGAMVKAMVGVPELATSKRCCAIGECRLANTIGRGVFLRSLLAVEVYPKSDRTMVVRGHTRPRGGGPKSFLCVCRIPFFPLDCRHSQHGKTCEATKKKEWSVDPFHVADKWENWVLVGF